MKRIVFVAAAVLVACVTSVSARPAAGSSFGCLTTARTLMPGAGEAGLGVGLGVGNSHRNSLLGSLGYGLSDYIDGTFKLGLSDADKVRLSVGAELKYQFLNSGPTLQDPLDLAAGVFGEYLEDTFQVGLSLTGSKSFAFGSVQLFSPYARFDCRVEGHSGHSELEVGLHAGARWGVTENISVFGELQLDGNEGIFLGLKDSVF